MANLYFKGKRWRREDGKFASKEEVINFLEKKYVISEKGKKKIKTTQHVGILKRKKILWKAIRKRWNVNFKYLGRGNLVLVILKAEVEINDKHPAAYYKSASGEEHIKSLARDAVDTWVNADIKNRQWVLNWINESDEEVGLEEEKYNNDKFEEKVTIEDNSITYKKTSDLL